MTWKRLGRHIVAQNIDNEIIVADLRLDVYHSITGAGILISDSIDRSLSREQILQRLRQTYDESLPENLDHALTEFLDYLVAYDLIKPDRPSPAGADIPEDVPLPLKRPQPYIKAAVVEFPSSDEAFRIKARFVRWQPADSVLSRDVGDGVIIVHAQKRITCKLTGCGNVIWHSIKTECPFEDIVASVLSHYDTSIEIANREVDELIYTLANSALIQPKDRGVAEKTKMLASKQPDAKKPFAPAEINICKNEEPVAR